jgi:hypothetical protein
VSYQHRDLAAGRWREMSLIERMANIGSEVERALNWRTKNNAEYSDRAFERALELIDLSIEHSLQPSHLREITRLREILADYFFGTNEFGSSDASLRKYFSHFALAARRHF